MLLSAYRQGIFPMAMDEAGEIGWFSPDPRAVIPIDDRFHVPHGLRRTLRRAPYDIRINGDFEAVIRACATLHGSTWISEAIRVSYTRLHREGHAHSVEAWRDGTLVGGLYGVQIGGAFCGESMFHRATDASKVALVALVSRMRERGLKLLDIQWMTPHLKQFGACEIPRADYLKALARAAAWPCVFHP
jgi:leucyl/phenylalanyl-tRNA--protein transferase